MTKLGGDFDRRRALDHDAATTSSFKSSRADRSNLVRERQREFRDTLEKVIRKKVIPRMLDLSSGWRKLHPSIESPYDYEDLADFRYLVLSGELAACDDYVRCRLDSGDSIRMLFLDLFASTARELGEMWLADELSFADVTRGLAMLHLLVHRHSPRDGQLRNAGACHSIILASAPTEQHVLGMLIVSKIFELEGWLVSGGPDMRTGEELTALIGESWFDMIGLTASTEKTAYSLEHEITRMREASLNPKVSIMVGGTGFANHPGIFRAIGADELAGDADDAFAKAQILLRKIDSGPSSRA